MALSVIDPNVVAYDEEAQIGLLFNELFDRVQRDDVEHVSFDASSLTDEQKERLILRGTERTAVLAKFGQELESNVRDESSVGVSKGIAIIDEFLSHSWSTARLWKTIALIYHRNFKVANVAHSIAVVATQLCCYELRRSVYPNDAETFLHVSVISLFFPALVYVVVLLFALKLNLAKNSTVFFDKMCIHQHNVDLKKLGIGSIELFVRRSRRLVLLCDEATFSRLWCVFETAMFAHSRSRSTADYRFVPTSTAAFCILTQLGFAFAAPTFAIIFVCMSGPPIHRFMMMCSNEFLIIKLVGFPAPISTLHCLMGPYFLAVSYFVWRRGRDLTRLYGGLNNFRLCDAFCTVLDDRILILNRIELTWGSLDNFELFVCGDLSRALQAVVGSMDTIPYWQLLGIVSPVGSLMCWASLNTNMHSTVELVAVVFVVCTLMPTVCLAYALRIGFKWYSLLPQRPVFATLAICACNLMHSCMHLYVITGVFWIAFRIAELRGWGPLGGVLAFLPWATCETLFMWRLYRRRSVAESFLSKPWTIVDNGYLILKIVITVCIYVNFNLREVVGGESHILCNPAALIDRTR